MLLSIHDWYAQNTLPTSPNKKRRSAEFDICASKNPALYMWNRLEEWSDPAYVQQEVQDAVAKSMKCSPYKNPALYMWHRWKEWSDPAMYNKKYKTLSKIHEVFTIQASLRLLSVLAEVKS